MLQIIYIFMVVLNFLIILFTAKKINFLIIYYFSSVMYYWNAFVGKIFVKVSGNNIEAYNIEDKTYWILIINMIIILITYVIYNWRSKDKIDTNMSEEEIERHDKKEKLDKYFVYFITGLNVFCIIYILYTLKDVLFTNNFNKTMIMVNTSKIHEYYKMFTMFWFIYLVIQHKEIHFKIVWIVSILGLILTFLLGHRSFLVIAGIAVAVYIINEKLWKKGNTFSFIVHNKIIILLAIVCIFIVFFIKGVTAALFDGNFDLVWSRLTNVSYYSDTLKISEPNVIISNMNGIVKENYRVDFSSYAVIPTYLVPGLTSLMNIESFTTVYQRDLFGTNNRASTILGEAYANGGLLMVVLVDFIITALLVMIYKFYKRTNDNIWKTFWLLSGIDLAFFIHRNSADYAICRVRYYFYFVVGLLIVRIFINTLIEKNRSRQDNEK